MQTEQFNYIVIGAGTTGCALIERLSRDPKVTVLVIEAGHAPDSIKFKLPLAFTQLWGRDRTTWGLSSEPEPQLGNRRLPIPRGKVLGGTSSINGMIFNHGQPADYDTWAEMGLDGWRYSELLPYFRAQERNWRGETPVHGAKGPVGVSLQGNRLPLETDALASAAAAGWPLSQDFVAPISEGFGVPDFNIAHGRRVSAYDAFLKPALKRANVTLRMGALTKRVLFDGKRAIGVLADESGQERRYLANGEVIIAAGALKSPQILELSGVGNPEYLKKAGIEILHALPGVGEGLNDQPACSFDFPNPTNQVFDRQLRLDRMAVSAMKWAFFGKGAYSSPPVVCTGIIRIRPTSVQPDSRMMIGGVAIDARVWFPGWRKARGPVVMGAFSLCYPKSRGWVHIRSANPVDNPAIHYNLLADPQDREDLRQAYRNLRAIFAQQPLARHLGAMERPSAEPKTDKEIDALIAKMGATTHHPVGSCRMGQSDDPAAVTDAQGRVHGLKGLRVIDASIFPTQIAGNPTALLMAIGTKIGGEIVGD